MVGLYVTAMQAPPLPTTDTTSSSSSTTNQLDSIKPLDESLVRFSRERTVSTRNSNEKSSKPAEGVPTGSSVVPEFPQTVSQPVEGPNPLEYRLLGLGIRTVSFLRIQVYVVGIYVAVDDIPALRKTLISRVNPSASSLNENEKKELAKQLRDPEMSEQVWDNVLRENKCRTLIRISPTRNTDFGHLRDGWVRGLTACAHKHKWHDEEFGNSMNEFKKIFGRGSVPKGQELTLTRGYQGDLSVWYKGEGEPEYLGHITDERASRGIWLGYLAGKTVACEDARKNVITSLMEIS
ncbi:hypothetical protein K3495_g9073 [Podosphaera aphanis]|nr:hypothetical protein K3495_g9073 [Podosphaera aphanis]